MIITTTPTIEGKKIEILGIVRGSTVQTRNIGRDILAGFRNIIGGEIKSYTELINNARDEATKRMTTDAKKLGADAIINVRYTTSQVMQGAAEVLAYGTAVCIKK